MFEIEQIYNFEYSRTMVFNGEKYYVLKYNGLETMPEYADDEWLFRVRPFPFQQTWGRAELEARVIPCMVAGFNTMIGGGKTQFPVLVQDINHILRSYYKEGYMYDEFTIIRKISEGTRKYYARDRFGFEHFLLTYGLDYLDGQQIRLRVKEIKNRNLIFEPPHLEMLPRHFAIGKVYPFKVLSMKMLAGNRKFIYVVDEQLGAIHRYPITDDSSIGIGDSIDMEVKGFFPQGWLILQPAQESAINEPETLLSEPGDIEPALHDDVLNAPLYRENIRLAYKNYLIQKGYQQYTSTGNPSTVYSYSNAVERVRKMEKLSWLELGSRIKTIVAEYGPGGRKEAAGKRGNNTVICALKAFADFMNPPASVAAVGSPSNENVATKTRHMVHDIRSLYEKYLIQVGMSVTTPSGNPSTVYKYGNAVENVRQSEVLDWNELIEQIENLVALYGPGGRKEAEGKKGNNTVICALKAFAKFIEQL